MVIIYSETVPQIVHGMNRDMSSYFVAKHGVVALTRSLAVISFLIFTSFAILFIPSERKGDWGGPFGRLPRIR